MLSLNCTKLTLHQLRLTNTWQKRTKAQKRKEKQAARDAEREARIAAEKEELGPSEREEEERALKAVLAPLGLVIKEIRVGGVQHRLLHVSKTCYCG